VEKSCKCSHNKLGVSMCKSSDRETSSYAWPDLPCSTLAIGLLVEEENFMMVRTACKARLVDQVKFVAHQ
jgi:hypothetical protein